jgi:type I restriction enzyme, R subunit
MTTIGKAERVTHNRVIALFRDELKYRYLGDWFGRTGPRQSRGIGTQ